MHRVHGEILDPLNVASSLGLATSTSFGLVGLDGGMVFSFVCLAWAHSKGDECVCVIRNWDGEFVKVDGSWGIC